MARCVGSGGTTNGYAARMEVLRFGMVAPLCLKLNRTFKAKRRDTVILHHLSFCLADSRTSWRRFLICSAR